MAKNTFSQTAPIATALRKFIRRNAQHIKLLQRHIGKKISDSDSMDATNASNILKKLTTCIKDLTEAHNDFVTYSKKLRDTFKQFYAIQRSK